MKVIIAEGTPKEIAALVVELQGRQGEQEFEVKLDGKVIAKSVFEAIRGKCEA